MADSQQPLHASTSGPTRAALAGLGRVDAWMNRLYGWKGNPLYQSGTIVVLCLLIMLVTGLYLLLFYRIGSPYESVAGIVAQPWGGAWVRSLHRYSSDLAVFAAAIHALRMFLQGRAWGSRALAWLSGVCLVGMLFVCGWTGYVMVWDVQAHVYAVEGARLLDALPLFAQRIEMTFAGSDPLPAAFFFLNMFLHIAVPIGLGGFLWLHVSRIARPVLMPPKALAWGTTGVLALVSAVWGAPLLPKGDLLSIPDTVALDMVYGFWIPVSTGLGPGWVWGLVLVAVGGVLAVPWVTRPTQELQPLASEVEERFCTGCEQCYVDCPYDAIRMVGRSDGRAGEVALVDPALCARCGICSGSCAPMGVGPVGHTGRDQLREVKEFIASSNLGPLDVVLVGCAHSATQSPEIRDMEIPIFDVPCVGNLHTSVMEYLVRSGAGGVLVSSCPPRDCWGREGPKWFEQRVYYEREAELKERVDRERVRTVSFSAGEGMLLATAVWEFRQAVRTLTPSRAESTIDLDTECEEGDVVLEKGVPS